MGKIRIYLDNCCFNRPYDDQEQKKILLETEAKLSIQQGIKNGEFELVWSYMLDFENSNNPNEIISSAISKWKTLCCCDIIESEQLLRNAQAITEYGIDSKDAIHMASAIEGTAQYFFTTDNYIIKRRNYIKEIKILNPVQFFTEAE